MNPLNHLITYLLLFFLYRPSIAFSTIFNKAVGTINRKIITQHHLDIMMASLKTRQLLSPLLYPANKNLSKKDLFSILANIEMMASFLKQQGKEITTDHALQMIKERETQFGTSREQTKHVLEAQGITFEEYVEIFYQNIVFAQFQSYLRPFLSASETEIEERYKKIYKKNPVSRRFSYHFFSLPKQEFLKHDSEYLLKKLTEKINKTISNQSTDEIQGLESSFYLNPDENDCSNELKQVLLKITPPSFSSPIELDDKIELYYLYDKEVTFSSQFLEKKEEITGQILQEKLLEAIPNWIEGQKSKHFIKNYL